MWKLKTSRDLYFHACCSDAVILDLQQLISELQNTQLTIFRESGSNVIGSECHSQNPWEYKNNKKLHFHPEKEEIELQYLFCQLLLAACLYTICIDRLELFPVMLRKWICLLFAWALPQGIWEFYTYGTMGLWSWTACMYKWYKLQLKPLIFGATIVLNYNTKISCIQIFAFFEGRAGNIKLGETPALLCK